MQNSFGAGSEAGGNYLRMGTNENSFSLQHKSLNERTNHSLASAGKLATQTDNESVGGGSQYGQPEQ